VRQDGGVLRGLAGFPAHDGQLADVADRHADGDRSMVPVRISLGTPKFWPLAASVPYVHELAPAGLLGLPADEFTVRYVDRLARIGAERIARRLDAIHADYCRPLILCCFEADPRDCHRATAARWLEDRGFGPVPEVGERLRLGEDVEP
jgi:hypothetical protein